MIVCAPPRSIIIGKLVVIATATEAWLPPGDAGRLLSSVMRAAAGESVSPEGVSSLSGRNREPVLRLHALSAVSLRSRADRSPNAGLRAPWLCEHVTLPL